MTMRRWPEPEHRTRLQRFDDQSDVTVEKMKEYGHPKFQFDQITAMQEQIAHCPHLGVRHALEMIVVKVVRLCNDPRHEDSAVDIAGYARTIAMVLDKEEALAQTE